MKKFYIILIIFIFLFSGCGSSEKISVSEDVRSILNSYKSSPPEIVIAIDIEMEKCMSEKNKKYVKGGYKFSLGSADIVNSGSVFYSMDSVSAGYKETVLPTEERSDSDVTEENYNPADEIKYISLSGVETSISSKSCTARAAEKVFGSVENYLKYSDFANDILFSARQYKAIDEIVSLYSDNKEYPQCMKDAGYPDVIAFGLAPKIALQKFGQYRTKDQRPHAEERAMAQADYSCQESSNIVRKAEDIFYDRVGQWLKDHEAYILQIRDIELFAKDRANKIINQS
ncbi:MAG: hypothetical protein Q4P78_05075 [Rothia sp. (in: high G+C Gram-positive bacteria)]|uniref:hypothetical protein n=1 Tax=Rothia sp. (in: high G+C Gram-positive bacteria) TaxID=1885016 RepID=UPI0026DFF663|nr:hypothetical protein [Rothia sp. (in: high G+C Gram-positive bacteria)]MDO5750558.1 hypothetical protein [Rothia sp. (in: high G+C Gram-positive bacteria)]